MWSRKELKDRAKETLRENYWRAFLVALVLLIVGGINLSGPFDFNGNINESKKPRAGQEVNNEMNRLIPQNLVENLNEELKTFNTDIKLFSTDSGMEREFNIPILSLFIGTVALGAVLLFIGATVVWHIFLGFPMQVGCRKYFLKASTNEEAYNQMTFCFNNEHYWDVVKTMFMRSLFNFLWFLALIIPGIIKAYAYSMVPYILSENPNMPYNEAISLSQEMTQGHKLDMWVLDLSFLGWYLLGFIFCGLGGVFVNPYYESTKAELYIVLSDDAIERGICTLGHLNRPEMEVF